MESTTLSNATSTLNPDSGQFDEMLNGTFKLILQSIVFLFGVPGNCLILRVYWTKTLKSSTHVFITGLAMADLAVCVLAVYRIYRIAAFMAGFEPLVFEFIISALETTAIGTSIMMTAVIAADRYDCVCRPHRRFFTQKRGKIAAWAAFVFSLVINIPAFIPRTSVPSGQTLDRLQFAFQVFCFVVALVMIVLCYGKVYVAIRKHTKVDAKRLQDSVSTKAEPNVLAVASMPTSKPSLSTEVDAKSKASPIGESATDETGNVRAGYPEATKHVLVTNETETHVENGSSDPRHHQDNAGRAPPKADAANLQRKTTKMLFITSVVFLLTWLPYWMFVTAFFASYLDPVFDMILGQLIEILYINNAVNPLIYGLANRRFRKDCKTVLSKIKLC